MGRQGLGCRLRLTRGENGRGKWRQIQARGAGLRDERIMLVGGGNGQSPRGRRFTLEEDVGSGCKDTCYDDKKLLMGDGRKRRKKISRNC